MRRAFVVGLMGSLFLSGCRREEPAPVGVEGWATATNGARLHYSLLGSGPDTVLVLAGGPAFPVGYLAPAVAPLANRHAFLLLDLRGRGASDAVPVAAAGITPAVDAADAIAVLDALGVGRAAVVAHHYGSLVALTLATRYPDRVSRVALVAPYYLSDKAQFDVAVEVMDSTAVQAMARDFREGLPERDPGEYCRRHWPFRIGPHGDPAQPVVREVGPLLCAQPEDRFAAEAAMRASVHASLGGAWMWHDTLRAVRQPLLVLQGRGYRPVDRIAMFWARQQAALAPDGQVSMLEAPGPLPWAAGGRPRFGPALGAFLDGGWPAGAERPALLDTRPPLDSLGY